MATLNMSGPFELTTTGIDGAIHPKKIGNYALGYIDGEGVFIVKYVGRSDSDLRARLKTWVGQYNKFKASYADSPKAAFEKECHNYHDFGGAKGHLDNKYHPDRPDGTDWECPVCTIFDN